MKLNFLPVLALACALGLAAVPAFGDIIVTPDQFTFTTWNNLQYDTTGAYPGDDASGYAYTNDYSQSPSGLVNIPLSGLAPGWNLYRIYEWNPVVTSQYHAVNVINNGIGYGTSVVPGEPWAGQFGTQQQWLEIHGSPAPGWVQAGPGPQSDPALGGDQVWINGSGAPSYLQIHYSGFENTKETFDAFKVVQVVPEPASGLLMLVGGVLTVVRRRRRTA